MKLFRLIKSLLRWNERLAEDRERQQRGGYKFEVNNIGPERCITYSEGNRRLEVMASFSFGNDVTLYVDSLRKWITPRGVPLLEHEFDLVLGRTIQYLSCWGAVELNYSHLQDDEELKRSLTEQGIDFTEFEPGVIVYSIDADELRRKPDRRFD